MFDAIDPLAALRDIHVPAASWWPLSLTQWLMIFGLILLVAGLWAWRQSRARRDPYRVALRELTRLKRRHETGEPVGRVLADLATLLRRIALETHPRSAVAGLCGEPWVEFLNGAADGTPTFAPLSRELATAPYQPHPSADASRLLVVGESLIRSLVARGTLTLASRPRARARAFRDWSAALESHWRIRTACRRNDAVGARQALLSWGCLAFRHSPPNGLSGLAMRCDDDELSRLLEELDRCLYGRMSSVWTGGRLWNRWRRVHAGVRPRRSTPRALPDLYS